MKKITTYEIAVCGIMAALMCILGPMSVQIGPVPISLTNLVLYFSVYVLETRGTSISYIIYLLLGTCGLPVFSGYQGGPGKLMGPTGGYLFGFILMVLICGLSMELSKVKGVPVSNRNPAVDSKISSVKSKRLTFVMFKTLPFWKVESSSISVRRFFKSSMV